MGILVYWCSMDWVHRCDFVGTDTKYYGKPKNAAGKKNVSKRAHLSGKQMNCCKRMVKRFQEGFKRGKRRSSDGKTLSIKPDEEIGLLREEQHESSKTKSQDRRLPPKRWKYD